MIKLIFFLPIILFYTYASALDEPNLDILLSSPKTYTYISDDSNMTLVASNGSNGILNVKISESLYSPDFNTTLKTSFNYVMNWTGEGYEGISSKTNWVALDVYYNGIRLIVTFDKFKRYVYLDLSNKIIKYKTYSLYKINYVGYETQYFRDINESEEELSSSSYSSYLASFEATFNSFGTLIDTDIPTNVKNQIFDDLSYNYSPIANAGLDQIVNFGSLVTLNASESYDNDGTINSFIWKEGSTILSTSQSFSKSDFQVGVHILTLVITDNDGSVSNDTVVLTVNILDTDNDGLPDDYENANGLNPLIDDSNVDLDNDGKTNIEEFNDGTNPDDENSRVYVLTLKTGWNLISLELNSSIVLNDLDHSNIDVIRSLQNNIWKNWIKDSNSNTLSSLEDGYGYWIKASESFSISILGNGVANQISLNPNKWNMLGSQSIENIDTFFINNPNIKILWKYKDGKYQAISNDMDISQDLSDKNIEVITEIKVDEGFFVK